MQEIPQGDIIDSVCNWLLPTKKTNLQSMQRDMPTTCTKSYQIRCMPFKWKITRGNRMCINHVKGWYETIKRQPSKSRKYSDLPFYVNPFLSLPIKTLSFLNWSHLTILRTKAWQNPGSGHILSVPIIMKGPARLSTGNQHRETDRQEASTCVSDTGQISCGNPNRIFFSYLF